MSILVRFREKARKILVSKVKYAISGNNFSVGRLAERLDVAIPAELDCIKRRKIGDIVFSHIGADERSAVVLLAEDEEKLIGSLNLLKKKSPLVIFLNKKTYEAMDKGLIDYENAPLVLLDRPREQLMNLLSPVREAYRGKVIGITGSFGKTTTKLFIEKILKDKHRYRLFSNKANNNSDFSVAANVLSNMRNFYRYFLQEVGAARVDSIKTSSSFLKPDYAIVTNVKEHHIGNYGSFDKLFFDKLQLVENLADGGTAIVNYDDEKLRSYEYRCNTVSFGIDADCPLDYRAKNIESVTLDGRECVELDIEHSGKLTHITANISGKHNAYNILAAFALADCLGFSESHTVSSISEISMRGNRQNLTRYGKNTLLVDCYNVANETIIGSFNILSSITPEGAGRRIAIVGAENSLGKNRIPKTVELGRELAKFDIDRIVCFGSASKDEKALQRYGDARTLYRTLIDEGKKDSKLILSKQRLYEFLRDEIKDDDVVLFKCITHLGATLPVDKAFGTWFSANINQVRKHIVLETEDGLTGYKINFMNESLITKCDIAHLRADSLTVPDTFLGQPVFGIDDGAFLGGNMKTLDLGGSLKLIGSSAFRACTRLGSVSFPDSLMHIMSEAFRDCSGLREITLGKGLRQIDSEAFAGCSSLERCFVPEASSVRIEKNAFPANVEIIETTNDEGLN